MGLAETFKALSDPTRRKVLTLLKDGAKSAGEIARAAGVSEYNASYHLSVLKKADLVSIRKQKNFIFYELNTTVFEEIVLWLSEFCPEPNENLDGGKYET